LEEIRENVDLGNFDIIFSHVEEWYVGTWMPEPQRRGRRRVGPPKMVRKTPRFPLTTWNQYERTIADKPRTNNSTEAFNGAFAQDLGRPHPQMWELLSAFQKEANSVSARIASSEQGTLKANVVPKYKACNDRIKHICHNFGQYQTRLDYLKAIGNQLGSF